MQFRGASCLEGCMLVSDFGSLEAISPPLSRFLESILTVKHWDDKAFQHVCCLAVLGQMQLDSKPFYNTKSVLVKECLLPLFMYKLNIFSLMSQGSGTQKKKNKTLLILQIIAPTVCFTSSRTQYLYCPQKGHIQTAQFHANTCKRISISMAFAKHFKLLSSPSVIT